jgi:hypothetical protein
MEWPCEQSAQCRSNGAVIEYRDMIGDRLHHLKLKPVARFRVATAAFSVAEMNLAR